MVSDLWKHGLMCPKISLEKKVRFQVFKFYVFLFFTLFVQSNFMDWHCNFTKKNCLETCVNCVWNCVTPLFTPLEVQFSKIFFSSKTHFSLIWNARLVPKVKFERYWWEEPWIFLIRALQVTILRKVSRCVAFSLALTFTFQV